MTSDLLQMLSGAIVTIELMVLALACGLTLAITFTLLSLTKQKILLWPINAFIYFIRGTPLLVQIFLIYYGSGQFDLIRDGFLWVIFKQPFACAVIALALNTSAYTTVLLRGAIASVPSGEIQAAKALGMSYLLTLRRIIFPRAIRFVLPAYSNEVVMVLKGTSLASTITLLEIMGVTRQIIAQNYQTIEFFLLAGLMYLVLNGLVISVFKYFERKLAYQ